MTTRRQSLARWGESLAADFLTSKGYDIIARNARTPYGEIDLIAKQTIGKSSAVVTVFVEVKTRSSSAYGFPEESVTPQKQAHLLAAAQHYLQTHPDLDGDWRVDVIAIRRQPPHPPEIVHFENVLR
jgi:putative endonuclease